ncbi:MAG TPA: efflux RND transporter periplasmic adaptor subunit [Pyrinomonadaceae bacterium]|nr:efflux RND transporter periplasmic adaptor subunit [Pyrinomonadaceae bacterium]
MALSRKRKIIIAVSAAALVGIIIVVSILAGGKDEQEVTTVTVKLRPELRSTVTASGEVRPIQFINLTSEVAGRIEEIYVKEGQLVSKGQQLVRLDPTQLQSNEAAQAAALQAALSDTQNARTQVIAAQNGVATAQQSLTVAEASLAQARQQVVTAQTTVDSAQVNLNTAQRELKRTTELVESNVASRAEYDAARDRFEQARVALRTAQANLDAQKIAVEEAKARVNQQRIAVRNAQTNVVAAQQSVRSSEARATQQQAILRGQGSQLSKTMQLAPITGVVADIPSKVGQFAIAQLSSTPLMTIADMSTVNVEVKVDETEIADVEVGQPAKVKVDAFQDREIEGVVTQKTPLAVGKSSTQGGLQNTINVQEAKEFRVVVQLNISDEIRNGLKPGMSATAVITTKVVGPNVVAVPLQAIVEKPAQPAPSPAVAGSVPSPADKPKDVKGVYVLQGNKAKFVPVETGITGESDIQILSGVQENMEVITGPSRVLKALKDNETVKRQTRKAGELASAAGEK